MLDIYIKQIRSVLEFAAVVWHAGLTTEHTKSIERVQKCALAIILGKSYNTYQNALVTTKLDMLSTRRESLCLTFAQKAFKSPKYKSWFLPDLKEINTRQNHKKVKSAITRTTRFEKSTLPYLTHLLNVSSSRKSD